MNVKLIYFLAFSSIIYTQTIFNTNIDFTREKDSGNLSVVKKSYSGGFTFNKTIFGISYIIDTKNRTNLISANPLIYVFNLIDIEVTRLLLTPFIYSTYTIEKEVFNTQNLSISVALGQETNFYAFYHKTTLTTATALGLSINVKDVYLGMKIEKPWLNKHIFSLDPYFSIDFGLNIN